MENLILARLSQQYNVASFPGSTPQPTIRLQSKMLQISCSMASLAPHGDMGIVATGSPRAVGPRASCVNYAHISHVALEAMLQLLLRDAIVFVSKMPMRNSLLLVIYRFGCTQPAVEKYWSDNAQGLYRATRMPKLAIIYRGYSWTDKLLGVGSIII